MSIIIFDYDNTILPNSLFEGMELKDESDRELLSDIDSLIIDFFGTILRDETNFVYIITNSEDGWVTMTSQKHLPKLHKYINENDGFPGSRFRTISARTKYEAQAPGDPIQWKVLAFNEITNGLLKYIQLDNELKDSKKKLGESSEDYVELTQIISIGDGMAEFKATKEVALKYKVFAKNVKFVDVPPFPEAIYGQLHITKTCFESIYTHPTSNDLETKIIIK